jgi:beta-1,2-mannosidase
LIFHSIAVFSPRKKIILQQIEENLTQAIKKTVSPPGCPENDRFFPVEFSFIFSKYKCMLTGYNPRVMVLLFLGFFLWGCKEKNSASPLLQKGTTAAVLPADSSVYWALLSFVKADGINPIMIPGNSRFPDPILHREIYWEEKDVFNPATVVKGDSVYLLFRAQDKIGKPYGTSRIGLAVSADGLHFTSYPSPVLYPAEDKYKKYEWQGGCEDPRVVEDEKGVYYMMYTAYDGKIARLLVASSHDLFHWKKRGPVFGITNGGKYKDKWSKSGSIISTYKNGKIIATRINGKYWMYWGDRFIWAATSSDLINWTPLEMAAAGKASRVLKNKADQIPDLKIVVPTRNKKFDSDLVEPGPPAMITDKGILLLYNSRNAGSNGDPALPEGTYAASQVLLDRNDPTKIIHRMENYFIRPDKPYEITGQVNQVCFLEGLALFKGKYFLYYGTADSRIAVATRDYRGSTQTNKRD